MSESQLFLGKYQLVASLGRGGMGDVFLAFAAGPGGVTKLVVIKRLREEMADEGTYRAMLLDEARLSMRLQHPNVVQTFEVGEHDGHLYLAMEYLDGQPLSRFAVAARTAGSSLEPAVCARLLAGALGGLQYAHDLRDYDGSSLGVVHRDVSPQNVIVTYEGEVKLVDFGVAKVSASANVTEVGVVKGKLAYMAPEQARGAHIDRRADVFAAGVVLWEMVALRRLLRGETPAERLEQLLHRPAPLLSTVVPDVDPELERVVSKALSIDPDERYATAAMMRDALESYIERVHTRLVRRDEIGGRLSKLFERERERLRQQIHDRVRQLQTAPHESHASLPEFHESSNWSKSDVGHGSNASNSLATSLAVPAPLSGSVSRPSVFPPSSPGERSMAGSASAIVRRAAEGSEALPPASRTRNVTLGVALAAVSLVAAVALVAAFSHRRGGDHVNSGGLGALLTPGDADEAPAEDVVLRLCGSGTVGAELVPSLIEAFWKQKGASRVNRHGDAKAREVRVVATLADHANAQRMELATGGSGKAFEGLADGSCDVGMSSRPVTNDEATRLREKGLGDMRAPMSEHVLALDGIAIIVHPSNPLRSVALQRLGDVFAGTVTDWSSLGAPAAPLTLYARDETSGTFDMFKHIALGDRALAASVKSFADSNTLSDAVAADPAAIGFVGLSYVRNAKPLAVAGYGARPLLPSFFTIMTEDYPLSRRLYLYTPARPSASAQEFLAFALSPEGQKVVRDEGFVDLSLGVSDPESCETGCPPRYASLVKHARRVSLDFRFRGDSNDLDSRAMRDLDRLLSFLRTYPGARVMLLGFADAVADKTGATKASQERAKLVASELETRGVRPAIVEGLGTVMPVASSADTEGRERNRRVEVWLLPESNGSSH